MVGMKIKHFPEHSLLYYTLHISIKCLKTLSILKTFFNNIKWFQNLNINLSIKIKY